MPPMHPMIPCTHCGLAVPAGLVQPESDLQFCCNGCRSAYQLIHSAGLDAFYKMVDSSSDQQTLRERIDSSSKFDEFDTDSFANKFIKITSPETHRITMALDGIHCVACVWLVEKLPMIVPGVQESTVNWSRATIRIQWNPLQTSLSQIASSLFRLGYTPHPLRSNERSLRRNAENRKHLARIGIAGAAAGNNMIIAFALYLGMYGYMSLTMEWVLRVASCVVGLASMLGPGRVFLNGAWNALKTRTPHMDLPIALGLTVGSIAGLVNTIVGTGEIYFDSLSVLIFLLLVGRWIQFRQQNRAADAVDLLYRLTPAKARKIVRDETDTASTIEVSVDDLSVDDLLEIRPGDVAAADGVVLEGFHTLVDESILTGESRPAAKQPGDQMAAGTKNLESLVVTRVSAVGQETRIGQIVGLVEQASSEKPQIVEWANRIGGFFVVTVIALAVITFAVWIVIDSSVATDRAVALLIVACPCALALATPLAISVALGRLAKRKIMVKAGDVIQALSQPGFVWLDKTGTLTEGKMRVVEWHGDDRWIDMMADVEAKFSHPVANAFVEYATANTNPDSEATSKPDSKIINAKTVAGGIAANWNGHFIQAGNRKLVESVKVRLPTEWIDREQQVLEMQLSPCWIMVDDQVVALAGVGDRLRDDAIPLIQRLRNDGWQVGILSGDHQAIVHNVADQLGIDEVHAGVTPEEKLHVVKETNDRFSTTVMVGDGLNDSASLAAATVGIAVNSSAETSLAAAPVYLGQPGLDSIHELFRSSRSASRTIRLNFAASLAYNFLGAGLAMAGWINPLVAAVLMPISSLTVITLSLRSGRIK